MKKICILIIGLLILAVIPITYTKENNTNTYAQTQVKGYYKKNGTYVAPHYRSSKDGYHNNNWSVKGNVNPHTGKRGTKERW